MTHLYLQGQVAEYRSTVMSLTPPGCPRSSFNDVALHDCQTRQIGRPYRDAQDRLLWKDKTCPARTWLIMSWKALLLLLFLLFLLLTSITCHTAQ